jgi:hypothetical protein
LDDRNWENARHSPVAETVSMGIGAAIAHLIGEAMFSSSEVGQTFALFTLTESAPRLRTENGWSGRRKSLIDASCDKRKQQRD